MKTTSLYPILVTKDIDRNLAFYTQALDYQVKHDMKNPFSRVVILENEKGCTIELMQKPEKPMGGGVNMEEGLYGFRLNVDDMDEALSEFKAQGATILVPPMETTVGINMVVLAPDGVPITVIKHNKR